MCEPRATLLAVLAVVTLATPAGAQVGLPDTARALRRIDSLAAEHMRAKAVLDSVQEAEEGRRRARGVEPLDTQRVGVLTIVTRPDAARMVRRIVEQALPRYGALATDPGSPLAGAVLLVEHRGSVSAFSEMSARPGHVKVWLPAWRGDDWHRRLVQAPLGEILMQALPADMRAWLGRRGVSVEPETRSLAHVYRSLASAPSRATTACRAGVLEGCVLALGLADAGPAWEGWYDAGQLLEWAQAQGHLDADDDRFRACFVERSPDACRTYPARRGPPAPLDELARQTFLAFALTRTGASGYRRLTEATDGTMLERIAAAAGTTPDSLVAGWRDAVIEARPRLTAGLGRSWLATLLWALVLMALAMRSTRWRLG